MPVDPNIMRHGRAVGLPGFSMCGKNQYRNNIKFSSKKYPIDCPECLAAFKKMKDRQGKLQATITKNRREQDQKHWRPPK